MANFKDTGKENKITPQFPIYICTVAKCTVANVQCRIHGAYSQLGKHAQSTIAQTRGVHLCPLGAQKHAHGDPSAPNLFFGRTLFEGCALSSNKSRFVGPVARASAGQKYASGGCAECRVGTSLELSTMGERATLGQP